MPATPAYTASRRSQTCPAALQQSIIRCLCAIKEGGCFPCRRHQNANSDHYVKLEPVMFHRNILRRVPFGNAECLLFRGKDLLAVTLELLKKDPDLFGSGAPVPPEWY